MNRQNLGLNLEPQSHVDSSSKKEEALSFFQTSGEYQLKITKNYWQLGTILILLGLALALTGCAGNSAGRIMDDARRYTAITRTEPGFRPSAGAKLVWFSDIIVQDENASVRATPEQIALIQQTIESQLIRKNYLFTDDIDSADYMVAAALIGDDSTQSRQITELVQLFPELANAFNDLEQGTLLVVISPPTDPRTATLLWRGAIQAYTVGEALSPELRMSRLRSYTARLIDAVPEAEF